MNVETLNKILLENVIKNDSNLSESDYNVFQKYKNFISNSQILLNEQKVYNNLKNKTIDDTVLAMRYLDENIKLFEIYTLNEFDNEHSRLETIIADSKLFESDNTLINENSLYNAVITIIRESLTDYEDKNVNNLFEAQTTIINHIKSKKEPYTEIDTDSNQTLNETIIEIAINKFNEKYNTLNEGDLNLIKTLSGNNYSKKLEIYETYKLKALELLNESITDDISSTTKEYVDKSINKLNTHKPEINTINEDIIKIYDLISEISS